MMQIKTTELIKIIKSLDHDDAMFKVGRQLVCGSTIKSCKTIDDLYDDPCATACHIIFSPTKPVIIEDVLYTLGSDVEPEFSLSFLKPIVDCIGMEVIPG